MAYLPYFYLDKYLKGIILDRTCHSDKRQVIGNGAGLVWESQSHCFADKFGKPYTHSFGTDRQHDYSHGNCRTMLSLIIKQTNFFMFFTLQFKIWIVWTLWVLQGGGSPTFTGLGGHCPLYLPMTIIFRITALYASHSPRHKPFYNAFAYSPFLTLY